MKSYLSLVAALLLSVFASRAADVVTSTPSPLQESSENVVIYFHADRGNQGMKGLDSSAQVYAHTGVLTNESKSSADWKHGPSKWGDNDPKYKLSYVDTDLWKLDIGNIRDYYQITEGETVTALCFVFRTGDNKKVGKDEDGGDIFVSVVDNNFHLSLTNDLNTLAIIDSHKTVKFTAAATMECNMEILVDGTSIGSAQGVKQLEASYTFEQRKNYEIKAVATLDNGTKVEQTQNLCYPNPSAAQTYPGTLLQGAHRNADGTVTFCLAAPEKENVILVGSWCNFECRSEYVMNYQDDANGNRFFWVNVSGLDPDTIYTYYYQVGNVTKVADPYAKLILDPGNDHYISEEVYPDMPQIPAEVSKVMLAVYHENINKYDWSVTNFQAPAPENLIIYELLLRDFTGTEGEAKGNGTLRKAMEKIPYLKELGINAIELLPINEFAGNLSWGYNPNFYFAPDKAYGTPDDYKAFIDLCHENGIAVILDLVFNQSDGQHPWYKMYGSASRSPFYNGKAPHDYNVLNDWNQDHPLVEQQWKDCVKYWLTEYKVDGFRFDLVKGLGDNNSYGSGTEAYNASRVARMTRIHAAMKEVNPNAYCINENLAGMQEEKEMGADGQLCWANVNNSSCQYAMGYSSDSALNRFRATADSRLWGTTVSYAESHDEERMGYKQTKWGVAGVKNVPEVMKARIACVGAQMILQPGAHMIWQFSEMGNTQTTKNTNGGNNTDNKIVPWGELNDEYTRACVDSWADFAFLRTKYAHLFAQDATFSASLAASNWAKGRKIYAAKGDEEIIVVLNPNTAAGQTITVTDVKFALSDNSAYKLASKTYGTEPTFNAAAKTVTLPSNSYAIYVRSGMTGVENVSGTDGVKVYTQGGDIQIVGDYTLAETYTISGARAPMTGLASGIYVVVVDGTAFKVMVR